MAIAYCTLCKRRVEARRQIGVGTLILVLITTGLWLIAIPFYSPRCSICKSDQLGEEGDPPRVSPGDDRYRGERGQKVGAWLGRVVRSLRGGARSSRA